MTAPAREALLAALIPEITARAGETEAARTLPPDLARRLHASGLFDVLRPESIGGLGLDATALLDIASRLSAADGSVGFGYSVAAAASAVFAWLDPALAGAHPGVWATLTPAGQGTAEPDGRGGYLVSGRWEFSTGCEYADWFGVGVVVCDGGQPRLGPDGVPEQLLALVPAAHGEIVHTWLAPGLAGTGSHDVALGEVRVAAEWTIPLGAGGARTPGPLAGLSVGALLALNGLGFPLGIARRALDEFTELARTKWRGNTGSRTLLAADEYVQVELGRAEGELRGATAYAYRVAGDCWADALAGQAVDEAELELAASHVMEASVAAVSRVFHRAGASISRDRHPLDRCFRDIQMASQHGYFGPRAYKSFAARLLARDR